MGKKKNRTGGKGKRGRVRFSELPWPPRSKEAQENFEKYNIRQK